jgi:cytochrome P450
MLEAKQGLEAKKGLEAEELPTYPWTDQNKRCPLDPAPVFSTLRNEHPIFRVPMTYHDDVEDTAWLVTRYEDVRTVLADPRFSTNRMRPGFPKIVPTESSRERPGTFSHMDAPEHTRFRKMLSRDFSAKRIEALRPGIQKITDGLLDAMAAQDPPVDLVEWVTQPLPARVMGHIMGVPEQDYDFFVEMCQTLFSTKTVLDQRHEAQSRIKTYLHEMVASKERDPGEDLLSQLVVNQVRKGELEHMELLGMTILMMLAGYETTTSMMGLAVVTLLQHPEQLAEMRADPALVRNTVEETLRHQQILHTGILRQATADVEVGGQLIKAGEGVITVLGVANRDERMFEDPDRFDIHRAGAKHHVSFGQGMHLCVGIHLARAEMQILLGTLFQRFPNLQLAAPVEELPFKHDMLIYGLHKLPVTW